MTIDFKEDRIIKRKQWGALSPVYGKPYFLHVPNKVIFHHYGFPDNKPDVHIMPLFKGDVSIRELQLENMNKDGLIDIKFHFIIAPDGRIYEGRPTQYMGKHIDNFDNGSIGVLCFGNFNVEVVPEEIKTSIIWLIVHLKNKHVTMKFPECVFSHRCKSLTTCPGHNLYRFINQIKNLKKK